MPLKAPDTQICHESVTGAVSLYTVRLCRIRITYKGSERIVENQK